MIGRFKAWFQRLKADAITKAARRERSKHIHNVGRLAASGAFVDPKRRKLPAGK